MQSTMVVSYWESTSNHNKFIHNVSNEEFSLSVVIIGMMVAASFGISLGMGITCLIPVSFVVIGLFAYQNMKKNLPVGQAILNGGLPPV